MGFIVVTLTDGIIDVDRVIGRDIIVSEVVSEDVSEVVEYKTVDIKYALLVSHEVEVVSESVIVVDDQIVKNDEEYKIPEGNFSFKSFTDYRKITDKTSLQWQVRMASYTDSEGLRRLVSNNDLIIALGTYYTNNAGDRFKITLDTGSVLMCTIGDVKDDSNTSVSSLHRLTKDGNLLEIHIDQNVVSREVLLHGDVSYADESLVGNVVKIEKILE